MGWRRRGQGSLHSRGALVTVPLGIYKISFFSHTYMMWVLEQPAQETKGPAGRFPKDGQPVSLEGRALGGKCFYLLQDSRPTPAKNWHPNSPQILGGFPKGRALLTHWLVIRPVTDKRRLLHFLTSRERSRGSLEFLTGTCGGEDVGIQRLQGSVEHHGKANRRQGCFQRAWVLSGVIAVKTLNTEPWGETSQLSDRALHRQE